MTQPENRPAILVLRNEEETGGYAGRLRDDLGRYFGAERVRTVTERQRDALTGSEAAIVAVIGPDWSDTITDTTILSHAFDHEQRVIPVLVGGAALPPDEGLPPELRAINRRVPFELTNKAWPQDLSNLVAALSTIPEIGKPREAETEREPTIRVVEKRELNIMGGVVFPIFWLAVVAGMVVFFVYVFTSSA